MTFNDVASNGFDITNPVTNSSIYTFTVLNPLVDDIWSIFTDSLDTSVTPIAQLNGGSNVVSVYYVTNSIYVNSSLLAVSNRADVYNATTNKQNIITMDIDSNLRDIASIFSRRDIQLGGRFQEMILFESDEAANKTAIELDINTYYTIY